MKHKRERSNQGTLSIDSVPILKAGSFTDAKGQRVHFTLRDLDTIVTNTNALLKTKLLEPPVKLGHDEDQKLTDGMPALGHVNKLFRVGDQIFADLIDIPKKLHSLIQKRAYTTVSSEVYKKMEHPNTGEDIGITLRAVAILGADLPAIKGMGDIESLYNSEDEPAYHYVAFKESELQEEKQMKTFKIDDVKKLIPCCHGDVQKFMDEQKITEISFDQLAECLAKLKITKLDEHGGDMPECPEGFVWSPEKGQCVDNATMREDERHVCPKGMQWDVAAARCVPVTVAKDQDVPEQAKSIKDDEEMEKLTGLQKAVEKKEIELVLPEGAPSVWTADMFKTALDVMGGTFVGCREMMEGKVSNAQNFCAWMTHKVTNVWPASAEWKAMEPTEEEKKKLQEEEAKKKAAMQEDEKKKAEDKEKEEKAKMSVDQKVEMNKLQEKVKKLENEKLTKMLTELKEKNRNILLPKFDGYLDSFAEYFGTNENVVKLGEKEFTPMELFYKFLSDLTQSKAVIFGELAKEKTKDNERRKESIENAYKDSRPGQQVRNVDLSMLAEQIADAQKITYTEALVKASKQSKEG